MTLSATARGEIGKSLIVFFWIAKLCKIFITANIGLLGPTLSVRCMIYCYCSGYCLTVYLPLKLNRKVGYVVSSSERR